LVLTGTALLAGCSNKKSESKPQTPIVTDLRQQPASEPAISAAQRLKLSTPAAGAAVTAEVTFKVSEILGRTFLYGSDLQYSAINDEELSLTLQSLAVGHVPATFRVVGNKLQLVADQSINFESDINHPERLLHEFSIIATTADTLTINIERASPTLVTVLGASTTAPARTSWVRSVQYVAQGNYLMFESSIEGPDGSIGEFMESLFPRETLVPNVYSPLLADPGLEPAAQRFRFLSFGPVFMNVPDVGRVQTATANRYLLNPSRPIEWYVTANVPDDYLDQIRTGLEGWNRYSQAMWARDMIHFAGRLPVDVKIGDPRFNVINWDNVAAAGAAYESSASDPTTGIQSHSLIYLPLAWVNIGKAYWASGQFSERQERAPEVLKAALARRSHLGRKLAVACLNEGMNHISFAARENPEEFAKSLLKGVLFHEVGHALGLAHNFKGSLSYDPTNPQNFSTSIMDYNQYNIEKDAYESVASANGPLLEYDRQILSVLYNNGNDIRSSDKVLPVCEDGEADSRAGGVDPLCLRYDSGANPVEQLEKTLKLILDDSSSIGRTKSLGAALRALEGELPHPSGVTTLSDTAQSIDGLLLAMRGTLSFYFTAGAQSLSYMARANVTNLYLYRPGTLLPGFVEADMRRSILSSLQTTLSFESLPANVLAAVTDVKTAADAWIRQTPALQTVPADQRDAVVTALLGVFDRLNDQASKGATGILPNLRARVLSTIVRVKTAQFFMSQESGVSLDYENEALRLLETALTTPAAAQSRLTTERLIAAASLKSFQDTQAGQEARARVVTVVTAELAAASNARVREEMRALLKAL